MVKVDKKSPLNTLAYRCRWWFSLSLLFFILLVFFLKAMNDYNFEAEANLELRQLFSERQKHVKDFLEKNQQTIQDILKLPELKNNIEKLSISKPAEQGKIIEELRGLFRYHKEKAQYNNAFILSPQGDVLFELEKNTSTPFDQLNGEQVKRSVSEKQGGKQQALKSAFERVRMTLAPTYSEFVYDQKEKKPVLYLVIPVFYKGTTQFFMVVEVNHEQIYKITNNFEDLGETGEIVLGKHVGNSVILVAPTRKNKQVAFKNLISLKSEAATPIIRASKGIEGSGQFLDYLKDPIYAVWGFIPQLNLGMVIKKDISELRKKTILFSFLFPLAIALAFISFCLSIAGFLHVEGYNITEKNNKIFLVRQRLLQGLFVISLLILSLTFFYQQFIHYQATDVMEKKETQYLEIAQQQITHSLTNVESIAYSFAKDYKAERIDPSELSKRLERDLKEHPELSGISIAYKPYKYESTKKLYAPFYYRSGQKIYESSIESYSDYTRFFNKDTPWYAPTLKKKRYWTSPFHEKLSQKLVVSFSVPFYASGDLDEQSPLGVVTVYYPLSVIKKLMNYYDVGFSGYYFMMSEKGQYIYHPFDGYVQKKVILSDLARKLENNHLLDLGQMIQSKNKGRLYFKDSGTDDTTWIHFMSLPQLNWIIGKQSSKKELLSGQFDRQTERLILFIEILVSLVFLALILGRFYLFTNRSIKASLAMVAVILGVSNITLWSFIYGNSTKQQDTDLKITDPLTLNVFIDEQMEKAATLNEPFPLPVSTGFYIKGLDIDKATNVISANANIWQTLKGGLQNREELFGFTLPQTSSMEVTEVQEKRFKDKKTKLWSLKAKLFQNFSYKYYPFDTHQLKIRIEPKNRQQNLIFVPDIGAYRFISPQAKPGLSREISLSGFTIMESYFSYQPFVSNTNFGFEDQSMSNAQNVINFVIQLKRDVLDSAVVYLCPLLLILFFLFVTLLALEKWAASSFGAVSALLFTLVLLQRALRLSLGSNEIVYIEYLFFATYVMLLLAVIYIVLSFLNPKLARKESVFYTFALSTYWPILFSMWLLSTLYVFYIL